MLESVSKLDVVRQRLMRVMDRHAHAVYSLQQLGRQVI